MYTRTYFTGSDKLSIPENYDGNAFRESAAADSAASLDSQSSDNTVLEKENENHDKASAVSSFFERLPFKNFFSVLPKKSFFNGEEKLFKNFGYEELLIALLTLYMFFSKEGDKECAVMLLLLLFVA